MNDQISRAELAIQLVENKNNVNALVATDKKVAGKAYREICQAIEPLTHNERIRVMESLNKKVLETTNINHMEKLINLQERLASPVALGINLLQEVTGVLEQKPVLKVLTTAAWTKKKNDIMDRAISELNNVITDGNLGFLSQTDPLAFTKAFLLMHKENEFKKLKSAPQNLSVHLEFPAKFFGTKHDDQKKVMEAVHLVEALKGRGAEVVVPADLMSAMVKVLENPKLKFEDRSAITQVQMQPAFIPAKLR